MPKRKKTDRDGLYRRPDSSTWWASWTDERGRRTRRSTGTSDRREAEQTLSRWKLEARNARVWNEQPERSFDELLLLYLQGPGKDKRSAQRDSWSARRLYAWFSGMELGRIGPAEVSGYIAARRDTGIQDGTINRELSLLSAAVNWARRDLGWTINNPVSGRKLPEPPGRTRWLNGEQAEALLSAARRTHQAKHLADFIQLALHTGMRSGELLGLEWERVDLRAGAIRLEADQTKTSKRRTVPMNQSARAAMLSRARFRAEHCPGSPWVFCKRTGERITGVNKAFRLACERAGLEGFTPHDLRHTCAAWLVSAGVPLPEIRDLLGHSTVRMTERYAHLAPENLAVAVQKLDPGSSRFRHGQKQTNPEQNANPCSVMGTDGLEIGAGAR